MLFILWQYWRATNSRRVPILATARIRVLNRDVSARDFFLFLTDARKPLSETFGELFEA